jgi:hypothetical protein
MGTTVNEKAAMVVASTSLVVALANKFAASLSDFGAMFSSSPQIECRTARLKEELNEGL